MCFSDSITSVGAPARSHRRRLSNSASKVEKKLSAIALSHASPTDAIDRRTPASAQRLPNDTDVYFLGSTGRRNTHVSQPQVLVKRFGESLPLSDGTSFDPSFVTRIFDRYDAKPAEDDPPAAMKYMDHLLHRVPQRSSRR